VDEAADLDKANKIICDAKAQYPAACNSVETVLVHQNIAAQFLPTLADSLSKLNVKIRCDDQTAKHLAPDFACEILSPDQWSTEYGDLILSIKTVNDLDEAIAHINTHGSNHTEAMITEDLPSFDKFFAQVNSAGIFLNASTRFADGFRYGFGAEVGISTSKMHPRGPVGIEGLVTYKYKLLGKGQIVADYVGKNAKAFLHKNIK
jgi:glutamate-5-semialdehyde dehydrogenase